MKRTVREVYDLSQLDSLAATWEQLHQKTPQATFFQTLDWLKITFQHFSREQKLRLLVVYEGNDPVGLVPFTIRKERYRFGELRVLSFPLDDWGTFYGPIGKDPTMLFAEAMNFLQSQSRDWDLIDFRYLCEQAEHYSGTVEVLGKQRYQFFQRPRMEVPVIQLSPTWEIYTESQSKNWRRNMKREKDRAIQHGDLRYVRYRTDIANGQIDPRWDLFEQSTYVAEQSWQAKSPLEAAFCSPRVRPVLRDLHKAAAHKGMVDMNLLYLNKRPVAFLYNYCCQGNVYCLRSGFDANCEAKSLGTILLAEFVKDSHHRGDRQINFGPGTQDYKLRFATEIQRAMTFTYFSSSSLHSQFLKARAALDPYLPGFSKRCQKRLIT